MEILPFILLTSVLDKSINIFYQSFIFKPAAKGSSLGYLLILM